MSMQSDWAREDMTQYLCRKLVEKMAKYPKATKALKELGSEILSDLPNIPEWTAEYYQIFCK